MDAGSATCVNVDLQRVAVGPGPWAPGQREEDIDIERAAANPERTWCMSEVDIFADLDEQEMDAMAAAAPMKSYAAGALVYTPHQPIEALEEVVVCVMTRADVQRLLLGDQRIAARISETLGRRLAEVEQRLSDAVFKSVPERLASRLTV